MTDRPWPHPPGRPGSRIVHSWRCARAEPVVETVRKTPTGQARVCWQCTGCGGTDLAERLLNRGGGDDDPAAA